MPSLEKPFHWLANVARCRTFWLGFPLILYIWTVAGPFVADDLHLVLKAEKYLQGESSSPGLFRFARTADEWRELRDSGNVPWWTSVTQRVDLFRPLSEYLFCLDMRVFGRNPVGHRLVSLAWFAAALLGMHWLFYVVGGGFNASGSCDVFLWYFPGVDSAGHIHLQSKRPAGYRWSNLGGWCLLEGDSFCNIGCLGLGIDQN